MTSASLGQQPIFYRQEMEIYYSFCQFQLLLVKNHALPLNQISHFSSLHNPNTFVCVITADLADQIPFSRNGCEMLPSQSYRKLFKVTFHLYLIQDASTVQFDLLTFSAEGPSKTGNNNSFVRLRVQDFSKNLAEKMRRRLKTQWMWLTLLVTVSLSGTFLLSASRLREFRARRTTGRTTESSFSLASMKHVTKSLAELGKMDEVNRHFLFLNHVPKCGSEILILLLQKLQGLNNYKHVRLTGGNKRYLTRLQQVSILFFS